MNDILTVSGLNKSYGDFSLKDVTFSLPEGCITGFIGVNGAGKTTTLRTLLGLTNKLSGKIQFFGLDMDKNEREIKDRIGIVLDGGGFYEELSLGEMKGIISSAYTSWSEQDFKRYMDMFSLDPKQKINSLSKGMRMKYALALALSHNAELLIMDEPTSGLDVSFRREFLYMIQEAVEKQLVSVIFSTHLTDELERIADFIGVMENGTLQIEENEVSGAKIEKIGTDDYKPLLGDMPGFKELVSFCRGIYLKSNLRFASYVIAFFQFIFGSVAFWIDSETKFASGFMSGLVVMGIMLQYLGLVTQEGEGTGRRVVPMRVGRLWCLNRWIAGEHTWAEKLLDRTYIM